MNVNKRDEDKHSNKSPFYFDDVSNLNYKKKVEGEKLYVCNPCYDGFEIV